MTDNDLASTPSDLSTLRASRKPIRWWPAILVIVAYVIIASYIWLFLDDQRQDKNLKTLGLTLVAFGLLLVWMLLLSRLRWRFRFLVLACVAGVCGVIAATLEITGVTGDLIPVVEWRWRNREQAFAPISSVAATADKTLENGDEQAIPSYPQFGGPDRDGRLKGPRLYPDWSTQPPEQLWRRSVGGGWSGFATFGHFAVTMEQRDKQETVTCYHLLTGDQIWSHGDDAFYESTIAGNGPRSVPTISSGHVFTIGSTGILNCLELATGACVWSKNVVAENGGNIPEWGFSASPMVVDEKVIINPGGKENTSLVALSASDGQPIWHAGTDSAHYSSPVLASFHGVRQVLIFNSRRILGHRFDDGDILWEHEWRGNSNPNIPLPVALSDNRVLASAGYGDGTTLFRVNWNDGVWNTSEVWHSRQLKSKFANFFVIDDFIYGLDDGILVCVDLNSGEQVWKQGRYGHGQMILVGNVLLIMSENGEVVLLDPNPKQHRQLTKFAAFDTKTWNPPALAGEYLLVRNDKEAACYRLPRKSDP